MAMRWVSFMYYSAHDNIHHCSLVQRISLSTEDYRLLCWLDYTAVRPPSTVMMAVLATSVIRCDETTAKCNCTGPFHYVNLYQQVGGLDAGRSRRRGSGITNPPRVHQKDRLLRVYANTAPHVPRQRLLW